MSEKYILRHKLKNPTYETDSEHQWFNIIDILQKNTGDENNPVYENEIRIHGTLKDKNSVSTENIEDKAVIESKIDDKAVSKAKTNFLIYGNVTESIYNSEHQTQEGKSYASDDKIIKIEKGTLSIDDFSKDARDSLKEVAEGSIDTKQLAQNAVKTDKINNNAITWDKLAKAGESDNPIDWSNNLPKNTINQNGLVLAGNNNGSKVWATDDDGNPGWRKVSNQFDTKLFGAFISHNKPFSGEITISYTENFSTSFKSSTDYPEGVTGEGSVTFQYVLDIENNKIKLNLQEISFSPDDPTIQEYSWNIENHLDDDSYYKDYSYDFNEQSNIISLESFLYTYINFYLQGTDRYFNNIPYEDFIDDTNTSNSAIVNLWTYPLITYFDSYYERNSNPIISVNGTNYNIELIPWENYTNSYLKNWDYNHCGIWIET